MRNHNCVKRMVAVLICGCAFITLARVAEAGTFFIEEPESYQSGDCAPSSDNRDQRWGGVADSLRNLGWTGDYWQGEDAWPAEWMDPVYAPNSFDQLAADSVGVSIYAGHGGVGSLTFAYTDMFGQCSADGDNIQMGLLTGAQNRFFVAATCCYMKLSTVTAIAHFGGTQIMGFGNTSDHDGNEANDFFNGTGGSGGRNWYSWLQNMEDKPGWFTGNNTPVAVTRGADSTDANNNKNNCGIKRQTCLTSSAYGNGPSVWWIRDAYDNGAEGC